MELVILMGMQASGKSTFCRQRFFDTHVRINLDMLRTRHREKMIVDACLAAGQRLVIDNTNPTAADRRRYIEPARAHGFRIVGYYFQSEFEECEKRNRRRRAGQVVPLPGLRATHRRLEKPTPAEGFDRLYHVSAASDGRFIVEEWRDEV